HNRAISESIAAKAARVGDANKISAVFGRGEKEFRISAELAVGVVVVGVGEMEAWQAGLDELRAGRMRLDDVTWFIQSVRRRAGVEIIAPLAGGSVEQKTGIGPLRHAENLHDLALQKEILVQLHFFPILHAT